MIAAKKAVCLVVGFILMTFIIGGCSYMNDKPVNTSDRYPRKPITMIVPFAAGGSADLMARAMEKVAVKYLGQPLVVTNIPGGAATIGWNELASANPDGYTIGAATAGLILQPIYGQTRYHYPSALEPLAQVMSTPIAVVVRADQPWGTIDELISYAKEHPGEIKYSHTGLGTATHIVGETIAKEAGITIDQVPFRGDSEALTALLGGHVQVLLTTYPSVREYVKSGKVKVLAVAAKQRLADSEFNNVPTLKEKGLDIIFTVWQGIGAPKGLPKDTKDRLVEGLKAIIADPEFIKNMENLGVTVEYLGPQEFGEEWIDDNARLTKIVQETGIAERIAAQKK